MSAPRKLAKYLMRTAVRYASPESREWAEGMLHELDYIEGDWSALFWALGSTIAIFQLAARSWIAQVGNEARPDKRGVKPMGKKMIGVATGIAVATALILTAFGLLLLTNALFPALGLDRAEWTHILTIVVIPETIFAVAAVMLWRKRGPMVAGILLTGALLAVHVVMHFAGH